MKKNDIFSHMHINEKNSIVFVVLCSLFIAIALGVGTWDITFFPTDAKGYYLDAARQIPHVEYISGIHKFFEERDSPFIMHGKEMFIAAASVLQRLMGDTETLRPFVVLCILAVFFCSVLIFFIAKYYFGNEIGLVCYMLFTMSFWPYVYVLFAKHQPLGLCFFLLAVFFLTIKSSPRKRDLLYFLSGTSLSVAFFSSTVSALYVPYYIVAFIYSQYVYFHREEGARKSFGPVATSSAACAAGGLGVFVYFNYPDILHNLKSYLEYVKVSNVDNHFTYNQPVLQKWIKGNIPLTRGGWIWIIKYFFLIMPVLFPLYLIAAGYLLVRSFLDWRTKRWTSLLSLLIVAVSFSSPLMAEAKKVAQYGSNYFTALVGIILLIAYFLHRVAKDQKSGEAKGLFRSLWGRILWGCVFAHMIVNMFIFVDDIYPTRMAKTYLSDKIRSLGITELYVHAEHPYKSFILENLAPDVRDRLKVTEIQNLSEAREGYVLIPPVSLDSIYIPAHSDYTVFDGDIFLNELFRKKVLKDYALAGYKSLVSSRIWPHEEEILTYRYLMLPPPFEQEEDFQKIWLLDAQKVFADIPKNIPSEEYRFLDRNHVRNIGNRKGVYAYKGFIGFLKGRRAFDSFIARIYKEGEPEDGLIATIFRFQKIPDRARSVWAPYGKDNTSFPVEASKISNDSKGGAVVFKFKHPVTEPGPYYIRIYRTGKDDSKNYYRIYTKYQQSLERAL